MIPSVGRVVHYQRGDSALAALVTRVAQKDMPVEIETGELETRRVWEAQESNYDVWLAVFIHTPAIGAVEFSPVAIAFSATPAHHHWSWPPRVP